MRFGLVVIVLLAAAPLSAAEPALQRVTVEPAGIELAGRRDRVQLVVTGHYADGSLRDLTYVANLGIADRKVARVETTRVRARGDGTTRLEVVAGGKAVSVPVRVRGYGSRSVISFEYGLLAALSKQGCNSGGCHGAPSGKGGFRLSLRGYDPQLDVETLIREQFGRRTNVVDPSQSLLLRKPTMKVAHGGGKQLRKQDPAYELIRDWIAAGCRPDPADAPRCVGTEIFPADRLVNAPATTQQLRVVARFSDGSARDVTHLAVFSSSDSTMARIDAAGRVTATASGQVGVLARFLDQMPAARLTFVRDTPGFSWKEPPANNQVDRLVHARLKQLNIQPSGPSTDSQFHRRVSLDVTGLMPSVAAARAFVADKRPDKRARLIEDLLRSPDHAAFWATKWGDLFRVTRKQLGEIGVHKFHRWLTAAIRDNMPYDRFVRALLTAQGGTFENPAANYFRAAADTSDAAETTARHFLGIRIECAKCHNHPYERWTQDNYLGISAFFNRVRRSKPDGRGELVVWVAREGEITHPRLGRPVVPWLPLVGEAKLVDREADRRTKLADWLTGPENPFLARVEVNRLWYELCGQGLIEPIDDFRASNPPSISELLDWLAAEFRRSGFDRRHIMRLILLSATYQRDSLRTVLNKHDERCFSRYVMKKLTAEQFLDAICQVSGVLQSYPGLPPGTKATQLPSPDFGNSFMKVFGKPPRDTACQCERVQQSNLSQALYMVNGTLAQDKIEHKQNRFRKLMAAGKSDTEIIVDVYLAAYCRVPNAEEIKVAMDHVANIKKEMHKEMKKGREIAHEDIQWALINSKEFVFQH